MKRGSIWRSKVSIPIAIAVLVATIAGCAQPAPTPTPTQAPKAAPTKEAKPEAKQSTPVPKEATPVAKQAEPAKPAAKKELTKLRIPYSAIGGGYAPLWVTKEKGLFEKYGLDVEMPYIASSAPLIQSMLAGEISMAGGGGSAVVASGVEGSDVVLIASMSDLMVLGLYTSPSIQRIQDLKGKTAGVTRFGSATDFGTRNTLKKFGLEPDKDVSIVQMGGVPEIRAGLESGAIQASVFGPPDSFVAKKAGVRELLTFRELDIPYPLYAVVARKSFLAANRETAMNAMKALVEGIAVVKKDKDFTISVIAKYAKIEDKEVLEDTYQIHAHEVLSNAPYVSVKQVETVLEELAQRNPKAKEAKPEAFFDNSLVKELDDSGFIKKLYN
ncbi:MAG: ABC transporter substrate-binding protein [Chloroflexi bacterium]|nr:ABC transporter substrate-binding protein [Chloroflexota bacterium]